MQEQTCKENRTILFHTHLLVQPVGCKLPHESTRQGMHSEIWGSHSSMSLDSGLLGYDVIG
jgi:hypothetical protein